VVSSSPSPSQPSEDSMLAHADITVARNVVYNNINEIEEDRS
jgi:hypothetical protein